MQTSTQLTAAQSPEQIEANNSRRRFVMGAAAAMVLSNLPFSRSVLANSISKGLTILSGKVFDLSIDYQTVNFTGNTARATVINQSIPGPVLRWKEGETVILRVTNNLDHDSSIHWHGIILPPNMDGVPEISYAGIKPGETFEYQFNVEQSGTYWYHSHSGYQEQTGMYGAIVIDPIDVDPVLYDREYVVMLSDWSDEDPSTIYAKLKKQSDYYNFRERTLMDLFDEIGTNGLTNTWSARSMWNKGRMSDRDISDVTGYTYTYLFNGNTPEQGWQGLFRKGERVRLRFINGAAMTIFDVRIPGLKMMVVASDGQNIQPISVDEFRIGVAETYDVIVEPQVDNAYCIFAQSNDRTGFTYGSLTSDMALEPTLPDMDPAPVLGHSDMGMAMAEMDNGTMQMDSNKSKLTDHSAMGHDAPDISTPKMSSDMSDGMSSGSTALGLAGLGSTSEILHQSSEFGPHVDMRAQSPKNGLRDPGIGLREHMSLYQRKVLTYADIKGLTPTQDKREPTREIQLHLTGNMSRYMWSINGIKFADAAPLELKFGERVRIVLVNDTMMTHPMHLHGMWSELETGDPDFIPRKHTVIVQPGSTISYLVTADAMGGWAYHCHLLFHMAGMFRKIIVT
ncbi:copper resistance system multicopper oxidase [Shewanella sp. D64]|uniref:copper resistance system multicopper oxidase n=1 Tax=unclassified Shewanella TaxID=196818 RepID=UPI0022BA60FF|nr:MULTISPECIES: copper resistance system multicopper oxidase [unclassified Shewanella]MEC4727710.1 copper resistance system multicopper oxidase [Shewanella sp. D64]MEC4739717.1 copper resistance system multicopper oxidase [Shewanella sp. E94]WBJ98236.1 copper resistance system multicopper oxidase [Shewanella sp. MTB7]